MSRRDGKFVRLIGAPDRASLEIRRLCAGFIEVEEGDSRGGAVKEHIGTLCSASRSEKGQSFGVRVPLDLVCSLNTEGVAAAFPGASRPTFDLASPTARLALLARLGDLSLADGQSGGVAPIEASISVPLYRHVALIQRAFALHISERELATRIGVHPSTLFRYFSAVGGTSPARFLRWIRMHELARMLATTTVSAERLSLQLGFRHCESALRTMRRLAGVPVAALRTHAGVRELETRLLNEIQPLGRHSSRRAHAR